jgi:cell surface protein SprA
MNIDLTWSSTFSQNFAEFFKFTGNTGDGFEHLKPNWEGSYNISYLALNTLFDSRDSANISETYKQFELNRIEISEILGNRNPTSTGSFEEFNTNDTIRHPDYADGYGPYSQSVLIPAFVSAYTDQAPSETPLNILNVLPKPNWRFRYSGLSNIKPLDQIFSSLNITHGYTSNLSVNSFKTDFNYRDTLETGFPSSKDTLSGNYFPLYTIPNVTISEQFAPLIGIDITLQNGLTTRFEYKKGRSLSLSLVDYQLIERTSMEITLGAGYRIKGLQLPFKFRGEQVELENEVTFKLDFSLRDDITNNYKMDQNDSEPTQGALTYSISPTAEYVVNNRLSVRLYFDHKKTKPYTSASYPITNTNGGIAIRFTLAE